jgi:hypothetical protein
MHDIIGHYQRSDVFSLYVNREPQTTLIEAAADQSDDTSHDQEK